MRELPADTLTFLFTDIEGSTRQWEQFPTAMHQALARHDALLQQAITQHNGQIIKKTGDGFHASFATASQALAAVLEAQLALHAEPWPEPLVIRARMALHSGEAQHRDGDYYGTAVNRAARLMAVGHGGQALLSATTHGLLANTLPPDVSLKNLGQHRFKDLQLPETVYQILHPNLPSNFPPLKSLDPIRTNLPVQLTSFIGRESELEAVRSLLTSSRLLTLTGSGGTGKTRLALEVGADRLDDYPDGVWLVELAPLTDNSLVPQRVALALGLREEPQQTIQDTLKGHLKGKNLLLLLDNCEHLIEPCAQLVESLLSQCPNVKVLATSREPLRIGAEQTYPVPPLPTPDPTSIRKREKDLSMLLQYDAIRLFVERARQQRSDFSLSRPNSAAVASVCHRLDGIPLAIELAAARVRSLTVEQINTRLDQRFRLLTGGSRTALPRQQTLQALIDWSYDLLTPQEQTLLGRLSVFAGGWTLEAAEAVCEEGVGRWALGVREMRLRSDAAPDSQSPMVAQRLTPNAQRPLDVLDLLTSLVDKSLVIYEERTEAVRYRMLETVREYAQAKLGASGEAQAVSDRHRDWFLALAEEADAKLTGPQQTEWLARLETEHDNLRAALARSVTDQAHDAGAMLRFCAALGPFWRTLGYLEEGRYWCVEALASTAPSGGTNERTRVLNGVGVLAQYQGDFASARTYHEQSLAIQRELADRPGIAASLHNLASVAQELGDLASARAIYEESLQIKREIGDRAGVAISLNNLGALAHDQGDYVAARAYHEQSLEIKRELGDRQGVAASLNNLGAAAQDQGDYPAAWTYHEQSLAIKREIGNRRGIAFSLHNLGAVAHDQGNYAAARAYYEESLTIRREIGDQRGAAKSLHNLGHVAYDQGDHSAARHYYEESLTLRREIGDRQGVAASLHNLGAAAHDQGDFTSARDYHEQSLAIRREVGDRQGVATALHNLGVVAFHQGDYASARACFHQSLPIFHQIGDRRSIVDSLEELARLATEEGALERGARLWGAAASLRAEIGAPRAPREQAAHERAIAATRTGMEARAFEMAWDAGHTMPLEQTVAFALQASQL